VRSCTRLDPAVSGSTELNKNAGRRSNVLAVTVVRHRRSNTNARSSIILLRISGFSHPFITAAPRGSCSRSFIHPSSTALIVGPGLRTLLAQLAEHEITMLRGAAVVELEECSELGIDLTKKHWGSHRSHIA
jgi:hypothetical protein